MCGIAGFYSTIRANAFPLEKLLPMMKHRGPDWQGTYYGDCYCCGMRRLSINGLEDGEQPLYNESRDVVLVYNGEIYNYKKLYNELKSKGHYFSTHSDGEVICHLYEMFGIAGIEHLDGMYAGAIWDVKKNELFLFRDHAGEKPLYFTKINNDEFAFASDVDVLAKSGFINLRFRPQAFWDFFTFLWVPQPETVYEDIYALKPGHFLHIGKQGFKIHPYTAKGLPQNWDLSNEEGLQKAIKETVTNSIQDRMLSDVPIGGFLSGGLDSSIVMSIAAQEREGMTAYTVGLENVDDGYGASADEAPLAAYLANKLNLKHQVIRLNAQRSRELLNDFVSFADQPFAVSSGLGIMEVARVASEQGIKVLLSGDGADENFGGYSWYAHLGKISNFTQPLNSTPDYLAFQHSRLPIESKLKVLASMPSVVRACAWHYYASEDDKASLLNRDYFASCKPSWTHFENDKIPENAEPMDFIKNDRSVYLTNEMMTKLDRMMMAHSVEGRSPFAAPNVMALASQLRYQDCVKGTILKWSLRSAFSGLLDSTITERSKHGFNIPVDHWLKNEWASLLEDTCSVNSALSRMGLTSKNVRKEAFRLRDQKDRSNGHILLCLIILNLWLENTLT